MAKIKMIKKNKKNRLLQQKSFIQILAVFFFCFFTILPGYAQQAKEITGNVKDLNGEIVVGANIRIEGSSAGTITDATGNFRLPAPQGNVTINVSYIGYLSQKIALGNKRNINIVLSEDPKTISEVVVVGYGTQKKESLTGAISSVKNQELVSTKTQNVQNMLTGKIPGLRVVQKTSEPGQFTNSFDIRNFGSPLLVVDGVPRSDLQKLDPNEIESITVLKDASASIYGVRAANGVLLVTTKKGTNGAPKINYSVYYGIQKPADILKPVGAVDRMTLMNEKSMRSTTNPTLTYDSDAFKAYEDGTLTSTDWYGAVIRNSAPQQQHNVSLSGGSDAVTYFVNLGYMDQQGFWKSNSLDYNRVNVRSNIEARISKRLKFSLKLNGIKDFTTRPITDTWTVFKMLWRSVPTDKIYANDNSAYLASTSAGGDVLNPVAMSNSDISGYYHSTNKIFESSADFTYDVPYINGLTVKGLLSFDNNISDNTSYNKEYKEYTYNSATDVYTGVSKQSPSSLSRTYTNGENLLYNISLNYKRTFAEKHNVSALLLLESSHSTTDNIKASRELSIAIPYLFAGNTLNQVGTADASGISENAYAGFVGDFSYDYEGKYLAKFSFREDGSSKFPASSRWGFFPSGSVGWRMSEESFIKDNLPFINNLKIRGSYGILGDDGSAAYQYVTGYDYPNTSGASINNFPTGYVFGGTYTNALGFRVVANPNITWYTSHTADIGLDADFWNSKFGFTLDLFNRDRSGLLATRLVTLPGSFGATMPQQNLNGDRTKGFELELRHHNRIGEVEYAISANVAMTRKMNLYLERASSGNSYSNWLNNTSYRYSDIWFGYGSDGRYTSYSQIATSDVYTTNSTLPGDYKYEDWNGDGVIDSNDSHPISTKTNPVMTFGSTISASYKGFDLSLLIQGAGRTYVAFSEQLSTPLSWNGNALSQFLNRWHPVDATKDPYDPSNVWVSGYYAYGGNTPDSNSSFARQNGAYVRLKSAELGYSIPNNILKHVGMKDMRVYVNGYNLFTLSKVRDLDPEHPSDTYGYIYPLNKTINFGASLTF